MQCLEGLALTAAAELQLHSPEEEALRRVESADWVDRTPVE